jgi:hypothetical protein
MAQGREDVWEAFVDVALSIAPATDQRSRFADKPALWIEGREVAHREAAGVIDLRITRAAWSQAQESYATDPAVKRDPSRRDWIALHLRCAADLERVRHFWLSHWPPTRRQMAAAQGTVWFRCGWRRTPASRTAW